jgi:membrane protease YdiL (CAAX protease family)
MLILQKPQLDRLSRENPMNSSMLLENQPLDAMPLDTTPSDLPPPESNVPEAVLTTPGVLEGLLWILGYVMVTQLVPAIVIGIGSVDSDGSFVLRSELMLPALFIGQILGVCLSVFILRVRVGRDWIGAIQLKRPAWRPCLLAAACLPALMLIGFGVVTSIEKWMGAKEPTGEMMLESMAQFPLWFCLLVIAVGAAVNEELFCRGYLGRGLVGRYGILTGVLMTSIVFGGIHLNLPQGIWACILGVFLHLAYLATRSLWLPILLHFLNNASAVIIQWALPDFDPTLGQILLIALPAYALAIPAAWALYRFREPQGAEAIA